MFPPVCRKTEQTPSCFTIREVGAHKARAHVPADTRPEDVQKG